MFQGFCLQINKFEKATAFHFWKYIPYEMFWFLLIVKKFIPSILEAFVARVKLNFKDFHLSVENYQLGKTLLLCKSKTEK